MLERTLAAKGAGGGAAAAGARASPTSAAAGMETQSGLRTGGSAASTTLGGGFGSGVPLPPTPGSPSQLGGGSGAPPPGIPLSPQSTVHARGRLSSGTSEAGTGTPLSGYSSMAAEVGSMEDGMPRALLDSSFRRSQ